MKTLQEQYNQIQNGEGRKDLFLKEAKSKYPNLISNITSFNEAEKILKNKNVINENYVDLKPLNKITSDDLNPNKQSWENKFAEFLAEAGKKELNPIVNNEVEKKVNDKKGEEKIKAEEKETAKEVINTQDRNYDYSPKVDNINNVNAQEMMNGVYCEIKNDPNLSLEEAQAKVIKNLAKDSLHYVKEGQFGVEGLGYTEQKISQSGDKNYGGSGYSEKIKDSSNKMEIVKESQDGDDDCGCGKETISENVGGVVTNGTNPWTAIVNDIINEKEEFLPMDEMEDEGTAVSYSDTTLDENDVEEARQEAIESSQEAAGIQEKKKDHDGDGDVDSDDYLAARDKAIKKAMGKKAKKESIETKLAEIGKAGDITKLEAQLEFLNNHINEKIDRLSSINEDDNLKELIDKKKMKDMHKEIKLLEKRKGKMEKMYEKMCGKKYQQREVVDEMDEVSWNEKNNPTRGAAGERDPKKVGQSTSAYAVNK